MDQEFARGDRVRAKGGGPEMVVQDVYAPVFRYRYRCTWTDPDGTPRVELFKAGEIEAASPPDPQ